MAVAQARVAGMQRDAVFGKVGLHIAEKGIGVVRRQGQRQRVVHVDVVAVDGPVAGRDPGPAALRVQVCGARKAQLLGI